MINTASNNLITLMTSDRGGSGLVKAAVVCVGESGEVTLRLSTGREITVNAVDGGAKLVSGQSVAINLADGKIYIAADTAQVQQSEQSLQSVQAQPPELSQSAQSAQIRQSINASLSVQAQPYPAAAVFERASDASKSQPQQNPAVAIIAGGGLRTAFEDIRAAFESPLLRSLPLDALVRIFEERGGINLETLTALDRLLRGRDIAIDRASPAQMERFEQWLRVTLDNPTILAEMAERVPVLSGKMLGELVEMMGKIGNVSINIGTNIGADAKINTGTGIDSSGQNSLPTVNLIETFSKAAFGAAPTALLDLVRQIDSSNGAVVNAQISFGEAQRIVGDIANRLPNQQTPLKPEALHDPKQLLPQTPKNNVPQIQKPLPPHIPLAGQILAEFSGLTETAMRMLFEDVGREAPVRTELANKIDAIASLIDKIHSLDKWEIRENCQNVITALKKSIDTIVDKSTQTQQSQPSTHFVSLNMAEKLKILDNVRTAISSLGIALRPVAREERQLPQNFFERAVSAPPRQINADTKTEVFTRINTVQDTIRALIDARTVLRPNAGAMPQTPVNSPPQASAGEFLHIAERMWMNVESVRVGFQEAFSSLNLQNRVSPIPRPEFAADKLTPPQEVRQSVDALRMEILVDVSRALGDVFSSIEELRTSVGQMREKSSDILRAIIPQSSDKLPEILKSAIRQSPEKSLDILRAIVQQSPEKSLDILRTIVQQSPEKPLDILRTIVQQSPDKLPEILKSVIQQSSDKLPEILKSVIQQSSDKLPEILRSIIQQSPDQSLDILRTIIQQSPEKSLDILRTIVQQSPEKLPEILRSAVQQSPEILPEILKSAIQQSPEKSLDILQAIIRQSPEKSLDILRAIIHQSPEKLPEILSGKQLESLRMLIEAEESLSTAVTELEKRARSGSVEIMGRLKDTLKELNRLQFEVSKSLARENQAQGQDGQIRSSSSADVIRSAALTAARGLENLSLLAAQPRGADIQQQIIALPVKIGQEWTEVQVKFIKDRRKDKKKDGAGGGHTSVYLNVAPSNLGEVMAHFDYHPPLRLKLSLQCERAETAKWFRNHSGELREALARAGLPAAALDIHGLRAAARKDSAGEASAQANTVANGKVDLKI